MNFIGSEQFKKETKYCLRSRAFLKLSKIALRINGMKTPFMSN